MRLAVWCVLLAICSLCSELQAATAFYFTSSPDSWVGSGETRTVTPEQGFSFSTTYNGNAVYTYINDVSSPNPGNWSLHFIGVDGAQLSVGDYFNAQRMILPAVDHSPGMDFSGNYRGNNMLTGEFHVLELTYGGPTGVQSFAVDFLQYDEGEASWWNRGSYRYNSDIPITSIPEPSTAVLSVGIFALLAGRRRRPG
jgi:hypothetical protein